MLRGTSSGTRHGKGPCDREYGTLKKAVNDRVKTRRVDLLSASDFYTLCTESFTRSEEEHCHYKRSSSSSSFFFFFWGGGGGSQKMSSCEADNKQSILMRYQLPGSNMPSRCCAPLLSQCGREAVLVPSAQASNQAGVRMLTSLDTGPSSPSAT